LDFQLEIWISSWKNFFPAGFLNFQLIFCFSSGSGFGREKWESDRDSVMQLTDNASDMDKMKRQRQIESDSVRDGCVRWCQNTIPGGVRPPSRTRI
jgi:hypothetical protein